MGRKKRGRSSDAKAEVRKPEWKRVERGMWEGEVHGYRVLGLESGRLLYLRRHRGEKSEEQAGLFVGNVSPKVDGERTRDAFGGDGVVAKGRMGSGGWFLRIGMDVERIGSVLEGEVDVDLVESVVEDGEIKGGVKVWLKRWEAERVGVQEWARKIMEEWEDKEKIEKENRARAVVDDDGWVVVGRSGGAGEGREGRIGAVPRSQAEAVLGSKRKRAEEREEEMKQTFYKFQRVAKHRKEVHDLRKRWAEQKERITAMSKLDT